MYQQSEVLSSTSLSATQCSYHKNWGFNLNLKELVYLKEKFLWSSKIVAFDIYLKKKQENNQTTKHNRPEPPEN